MIVFPNAKINLGLHIVERRPDGYHNLETVFYPIPLHDVLEIVPSRHTDNRLTCYGNAIDCPPEKNLVMRAVRLMQEHYEVPPVDIYLHKVVPHGAGLGGGSSDASFAMVALNDMFHLGASCQELAALAATLGADCPFFIYNRPMMATGIGDVLSPIEVDLSGLVLFLVKPAVNVPTAVAYSRVTPTAGTRHLAQALATPPQQWGAAVANDFEPSVFAAYPELRSIKQALAARGALFTAMSGSGSAIFALFDSVKVAEGLRGHFYRCEDSVMPL